MASSYYDSAGKDVVDGNVAYAADLNDINAAVDTGFQLAEAALTTVAANQDYYATLAQKWAETPEDTAVTVGKYSALHWAAKAEDDATQTAADRVQTGLDKVATAADRVQTGQDKIATAADRVQTGLDKVATAADRVQTGLDVTASDANADRAETASAMFPTLGAGDQGKYLQVDTPYTNGIITATIDLSAKEDVLGNPASDGMVLSSTAAGVRSWKNTTPLISTDTPIYGDIRGGDITKTGANQLTITAISCLDSTGLVELYTSTSLTLSIPSVANTVYHIFIVKLVAGGTIEFRAYTTEAAVASDAQVSKFRWVGFWKTNGSSNCVQGLLSGDCFAFLKASESVFVSGFSSTTFAALTLTSVIPVSRVTEIYLGLTSSSVDDNFVSFSIDGTNTTAHTRGYSSSSLMGDTLGPWGYGTSAFALRQIPIKDGALYAKVASGSVNIGIAQVRIRR